MIIPYHLINLRLDPIEKDIASADETDGQDIYIHMEGSENASTL